MPSKLELTSPVSDVKGIGPKMTEALSRLDIVTVSDLIGHFPRRYLDFTRPVSVRELKDKATSVFIAELSDLQTFHTRTGKIVTTVTATDKTGRIKLTWFNNPYIRRLIRENDTYTVAGKPSYWAGKLTLISPIVEAGDSLSLNTSGFVPVYPQTKGVTSKWLRQKIYIALNEVDLADPVPPDLLNNEFFPQAVAYHNIHFPQTSHDHWLADKRLSFNEHLKINLKNVSERSKLGAAPSIETDKVLFERTKKDLPFELTASQKMATKKLLSDLKKNTFTHRLIQGDTGSGKTITVLLAADQSINNGYSVALMAPTEILANQHFETFKQMSAFPNNIQLVTASTKEPIKTNKPMVYIGTHSLINQIPKKLDHPLALVIIDEQHKFGVGQRNSLLVRKPLPHLVNLSATPIPRTVALGLLGDIELTNITQQPRNRLPTITHVVGPDHFNKSTAWLTEKLKSGNNIFVVCPNIEENGTVSSVKTLTKRYQKLFSLRFPVWALHGRMKKEEQNHVIKQFKRSKAGILISTSLIEVGIDIPQANVMIVHSAEHFGLAQLHQLRGRVGRGRGQGYFFIVPSTEDDMETDRLKLLQKYHTGLILAQKDLRLRGAGEVFGLKQHGTLHTRLKYFWSKKLFTSTKKKAIDYYKHSPSKARGLLKKLD